ncbi:MAG: carboxylating nicotinate-nucleotide diphosphorylase, partial [Oscillospiraceae bacterium]
MSLPQFYIDDIIKDALKEDINYIDVSADYLIPQTQTDTAYFVSKADGVLCGLEVALRVFELLDNTFKATIYKKDGDKLKKGDIIAEFSGKTVLLLKGERTALNLLQHMSGIATATNEAVKLCEGTKAQVTDTRKTLPSLRAIQKYAVVCGGGKNHRFNLSDGAMLKDNHIDAGGGITKSVKTLREKLGHMVKIEVETRDLNEVKEALASGADIIMLDNMTNEMMSEAVKIIGDKA